MNRPLRQTGIYLKKVFWPNPGIGGALSAAAIVLLLVLPAMQGLKAQEYLQVTGPCNLAFPEDHGPHPGFRTEWWYYTGNLTGEGQQRFGFQLTFFRRQLAPNQTRDQWPETASPWRTDQIYLAHAAITDITEGRHQQAEKMARPVIGMAGARRTGSAWTFQVHNWQTVIAEHQHELKAETEAFSFHLMLTPEKPLVQHGDRGYSRKGTAPERASCYYSFTRLAVRGTISIHGTSQAVTGSAWMDHEFSTAPLEPGITGWDWFSLQLSDRTELMIYRLRREDGSVHPSSSGTHVGPSGETRHLQADDIRLSPTDHWESPDNGARYPVGWKISIPGLAYKLEIRTDVADQEMRTPGSTNVSYWEGSIDIQGTKAGKPVTGVGYLEMTGYARPFDTDL